MWSNGIKKAFCFKKWQKIAQRLGASTSDPRLWYVWVTLAYSIRLPSKTFALFNYKFIFSTFIEIVVRCQQQSTTLDLTFYDIFALQKFPFFLISDDVIACNLWFAPPPIKILATRMVTMITYYRFQSHLTS